MLAIAGAGVWSLVIAYSAGNIAMDIVLWRLIPWRPRLRPQRKHLRSLLSFGGATTAVGIMAAFLAEFDNLVVGRVLGVTELGYYSIATKLPFLFIISIAVGVRRRAVPRVCDARAVRDERQRSSPRSATRRSSRCR